MRPVLPLAAACLAALVLLATPPARADDKDMLQGTWKATYAAVEGQVVPDAVRKKVRFIFSGDEFTLVYADGNKETLAFTLAQPARGHKAIDFGERSGTGTGKRGKLTGKDATVFLGIYAFEGENQLKLCWGPAGAGRPQAFNARRIKGHRYVVLEK